jgi:hypothetical protein
VAALPADDDNWRARMLLVVAAGPIATGCALVAACLLDEPGMSAAASGFLWAFAQVNFFFLILGLVPNCRNASTRNDARLFLVLLRNGGEAEQMKLYHLVTRLQINGVRPSAYPKAVITRLARAQGNYDLMLFNALTIFLWALDSGEIGIADAWDRHANALVEEHPLRLSHLFLAESACFDLLHRKLPVLAAEKLRTVRLDSLPPWLRRRAKVALKLADDSYRDAVTELRRARASLPSSPPYFEFESALLDLLELRALVDTPRTLHMQAAAC